MSPSIRSRRRARLAVSIGVSLLAVSSTACNVVEHQQDTYALSLRKAAFSEGTVETGAERIHVWIGGDGPPVLFLHGLGAPAVFQWEGQLEAFARSHRVIAPDLLWFGESFSTDPDPSIEHQVRAVLGLMEQLGLQEVDVVGLSYGGMVAHVLAARHPERVRRLVLVASPGAIWTRREFEEMLARFEIDDPVEVFMPEDPADLRRLNEIAFVRPPTVPRFAARQVIDAFYDPRRDEQTALIRWLEAQPEGWAESPCSLTVPTLVVWGRHDPVFPLEIGQRLRACLNGSLVVIDDARHAPNVEHPERFNRAVLDFLSRPEA